MVYLGGCVWMWTPLAVCSHLCQPSCIQRPLIQIHTTLRSTTPRHYTPGKKPTRPPSNFSFKNEETMIARLELCLCLLALWSTPNCWQAPWIPISPPDTIPTHGSRIRVYASYALPVSLSSAACILGQRCLLTDFLLIVCMGNVSPFLLIPSAAI